MSARDGRWTAYHLTAVALLVAVFAIHLLTLLRYPPPFADEAWNANRAWAFATQGVPFGGLDAGVFERYPGYWTYLPVLPTALHALPLWLAGGPGLLPIRLISLLFGAILVTACHTIGRARGGRACGLTAALLTSLSPAFFYSAHLARWDIIVAALGYLALALQLSNTAQRRLPAAVAGLLLGLAFEVHPHASVFVPAAVLLFIYESGWMAVKRSDAWAWAGGLLVGLCFYVLLHVAQYPATFVALGRLAHGSTHNPPIATLDLAIMATGFTDTARLVLSGSPFWTIASLFALVWLVVAKPPLGRPLLLLALLMYASFSLLVRNKFGYYAIFLTPALDLPLAAFLVNVVAPVRRVFPNSLAGVLVSVGLSGGLVVQAMVLRRANGIGEFRSMQRRIAPLIRADDVIMGSQTHWFGLTDRRYVSWEQLVYYRRYFPGSSLDEGFHEFKPTVLIIDGQMSQFIQDQATSSPYGGQLNLSRREISQFLDRHASLEASFDGGSYGPVRVYRLEWTARAVAHEVVRHR